MPKVMRGKVVEVADPRDGVVFAVAAGHASRLSAAEAMRVYSDHKEDIVSGIRADGLEPVVRETLVATPQDAFTIKRRLCAKLGIPYRGPAAAAVEPPSTSVGASRNDLPALLRAVADMIESGEIDGDALQEAIKRRATGNGAKPASASGVARRPG